MSAVLGMPVVQILTACQLFVASPSAVMPDCAHCRKEFESVGPECCSTDCERFFRERQNNLAVMAKAGIEPKARRQCEQCKAVIPTWRKGRRVSKSVRFCSEKCSKRAGPPPSFVLLTLKKCPFCAGLFLRENNTLNVKETDGQNWQTPRTHRADASPAPTVFRSPRGPTFERHRICVLAQPRGP